MPRIALIALLGLGLALSVRFGLSYNNAMPPATAAQVLLLPLVLAVSFIRPLREKTTFLIDRLRSPSRRSAPIIALVVGAISFAYLLASARLDGRDLSPRLQDEFSYIIQSHLLASGKLWLAQPALADFFESFHIVVKPVYASVYFPGTALLYVPGVWFGLPHYITSIALCGICVSLTYLLILRLMDGTYALLAAIMLLATSQFFFNSTLALSNIPAMMFALIAMLAWLKFNRTRRSRWLILFGAASGWGLITRPVDLLAYLLPMVVMILIQLRARRRMLVPLALLILPALPFVGLQMVFNKGVTDSWFTTPYRFYFDQFQPQTKLGFVTDDPNVHPQTQLQQKKDLYEQFLRPLIKDQRPGMIVELLLRWRIKFIVGATMASFLFLILLPIGLVGAWRRSSTRIICIVIPALYIALYTLYPYFMPYYALAIAPPIVLAILIGVDEIVRALPKHRSAMVFATIGVLALCVAAIPEVRQDFDEDQYFRIPHLHGWNQKIDAKIRPPAVILFTYASPASPHEEPVYNYTTADPMDAGVIRAQDLGPQRDRQIFAWFASHRPQTRFYRFNRGTGEMVPLGTAGEMERSVPSSP